MHGMFADHCVGLQGKRQSCSLESYVAPYVRIRLTTGYIILEVFQEHLEMWSFLFIFSILFYFVYCAPIDLCQLNYDNSVRTIPNDLANMTETSGQSPNPAQVPDQAMEPKPEPSSNEPCWSALATKDSLGAVLTKQQRFDEAETVLSEVLKTRETLGQSKTDTQMLRTMNNLAAVYHHQGRLAEAEALHRQVLEADQQILGSEHPETITSMHNLAALLARQGKLEEGREMQQKAFELSKKVHGPEAPSTLVVMGSLGDVLLRQDKYEQAETVCREVLDLRRKVLREKHPAIINGMDNLAAVLRKQGKTDEVEELHRQKVALLQTNPEETTSTSDAAQSSAGRGHYDEMERVLKDKVNLSVETSGRNSQETRSNMSELGNVLIRNGKYKEAENIFRDVLVAV